MVSWLLRALACFALALVVAALVVVWQFIIIPLRNPLRKIRGPPYSSRIFASHLGVFLNAQNSARAHQQAVHTYGRNIRIKGIGNWDDRLLSLDPVAISYVLGNPAHYQKAWQSRRLITKLIGCGMLAAEGVVHKRQRKVSMPAFSPQNLKGFLPIFFSKANELCDRWEEQLKVDAKKIDVCHWISRATFDVIGLASFSYEFHAIQNETNEVYSAFKEMFEIAVSQGEGFKTALRIYFPILWTLLPDTSTRIIKTSWEIIFRVGRHLVQSKKLAIEQGQTDGKDLLSLLLKSNLSADIPADQRISDDDLLFQISTFLFAGSDTTSLALTWILLLLSKPENHRIQQRLRNEISTVDASTSQIVKFSDIDALPYLDSVIKEGLRLVPPVHSSLRVATRDDLIPTSEPIKLNDGTISPGIPVAKGTMIHIAVEGFSLDKEFWGDDAWEFRPERWYNLPERVKALPGLYANLLCFSGGPRACIGMRFSVMEMKVFLYTVLGRFEFYDPDPVFKVNAVLTRPYVSGRFKEGSQCPIQIRRL